jgi:hypothetical protein
MPEATTVRHFEILMFTDDGAIALLQVESEWAIDLAVISFLTPWACPITFVCSLHHFINVPHEFTDF